MDVDLFDYVLPERLIAQTPLADRTSSRLLVLDKTNQTIEHNIFTQLPALLKPGDLLVLNDTRVIPARLLGRKQDTGAKAELLLLKPLGEDRWETLAKPGKKLKTGTVIEIGEENGSPLLRAVIEEESEMGGRIVRFYYTGIWNELLDKLGSMPLPPYIKERLQDRERYQTVYARHTGSAAAPTAGLHFTEKLLEQLEHQDVHIAYITLHVGLGTFRPVSANTVEQHKMHEEYYRLDSKTAALINKTKQDGGRVIAVGTTSCRALESVAAKHGHMIKEDEGWTDIFIYPGYSFRMVDALITNFHLPKSTLLMLVSALAGTEFILKAYKEAVGREYRFFSFGDAMFIH